MFLKFFGRKKQEKPPPQQEFVHNVDTSMNYCPRCGDEYRQEIATCAGCSVPLISGAARLEEVRARQQLLSQHSMELLPDDELLTIRKGGVNDIKAMRKLLADHRIPSVIAADDNGCRQGCCGPELYLQIKKDDMERATVVLTEEFIRTTSLDSHDLSGADAVFDHRAAETVCPACGCSFSPTVGACPECGLCFE